MGKPVMHTGQPLKQAVLLSNIDSIYFGQFERIANFLTNTTVMSDNSSVKTTKRNRSIRYHSKSILSCTICAFGRKFNRWGSSLFLSVCVIHTFIKT